MNLLMEIKKTKEAKIGKNQKERVRAAKQKQVSRKMSMRRVRGAPKMARIVKMSPTMTRIGTTPRHVGYRGGPCYNCSATKL
jgi:hypothetical protein